MPIRVKICGITLYDDARTAANLGADALGFIFHPASPRYIAPSAAREIIGKLPPFVSKVGVFVDRNVRDVIEIARASGVDTIQLHGSETPNMCDRIPYPVIKAFSVDTETDLSLLDEYRVSGFLLDTWDKRLKGGTGRTFDWSVAEPASRTHDTIILAGGLGPTNVKEAIEQVLPYGIDVNSGVEIRPGVKNPKKMSHVISIVKGRE